MNKLPLFILVVSFISAVLLVAPVAGQETGFAGQPLPQSTQSTEIRVSWPTTPECQRMRPAVAYNGTEGEYLVIWENKWPGDFRDIYAQRVQENGELKSHFTVATSPQKSRMTPDLAYNRTNKEYLVVYAYDAQGDDVHWEIWGRRVSWNGAWLGPEFQIFSWPNRGFYYPHVVWNSKHNEYYVVASAYDTQSFKWNDVAGRRVMSLGNTPYPMQAISAQDQVHQPWQGDVAYNRTADEYLVVWRQLYGGLDTDVHGARVRGDTGAVKPPGPFAIAATSAYEDWPAVAAYGSDRYIVAWQQTAAGANESNIFWRDIDATGFGDAFDLNVFGKSAYAPAVTTDPTTDVPLVSWARSIESNKFMGHLSMWRFAPKYFWRISYAIALDIESTSTAVASGPSQVIVLYTRTYGSGVHIFATMMQLYYDGRSFVPVVLKP